jgi:hypothetical protein
MKDAKETAFEVDLSKLLDAVDVKVLDKFGAVSFKLNTVDKIPGNLDVVHVEGKIRRQYRRDL